MLHDVIDAKLPVLHYANLNQRLKNIVFQKDLMKRVFIT